MPMEAKYTGPVQTGPEDLLYDGYRIFFPEG
jgi:hypothetical protein